MESDVEEPARTALAPGLGLCPVFTDSWLPADPLGMTFMDCDVSGRREQGCTDLFLLLLVGMGAFPLSQQLHSSQARTNLVPLSCVCASLCGARKGLCG